MSPKSKDDVRRAFERLFHSVPSDVTVVVAASPAEHQKKLKSKSLYQPVKKSLRVEHQLSVRDIAAFLQNPQVASYGTMQADRSQVSQQTMRALEKHVAGRCNCAARERNCAKHQEKLINEAFNRLPPVFTPWFTLGIPAKVIGIPG